MTFSSPKLHMARNTCFSRSSSVDYVFRGSCHRPLVQLGLRPGHSGLVAWRLYTEGSDRRFNVVLFSTAVHSSSSTFLNRMSPTLGTSIYRPSHAPPRQMMRDMTYQWDPSTQVYGHSCAILAPGPRQNIMDLMECDFGLSRTNVESWQQFDPS